jgi:hypothetical protein
MQIVLRYGSSIIEVIKQNVCRIFIFVAMMNNIISNALMYTLNYKITLNKMYPIIPAKDEQIYVCKITVSLLK